MTHWFVWHLGAELLGLPFPHEESFWSTKRGGGGGSMLFCYLPILTLCVLQNLWVQVWLTVKQRLSEGQSFKTFHSTASKSL